MKKNLRNVFMLTVGIVYLVVFLLLLLLVEDKYPEFWVVLALMYVPNLIAFAYIMLYKKDSRGDAIVTFFPLLYIFLIGNAVLFITGFIIIFLFLNTVTPKALSIIFIIEIALYLIALVTTTFAVGYVRNNLHHTKEKVSYIRNAKAQVEYCASLVSDETLKKNLLSLASAIRYSDPMSHDSLHNIELQFSNTINQIQSEIAMKNFDAIQPLIEQANNQLTFRNQQCINLK